MPVPHFFVEHDTLLHLCVCCSQVALAKRQLAQETLGCSDAFLEAHLLGQCPSCCRALGVLPRSPRTEHKPWHTYPDYWPQAPGRRANRPRTPYDPPP